MIIKQGKTEAFLVTSVSGRGVGSFEDRALAENWIRDRKGNGVTYRLFVQRMELVELGVRKAESLRLAKG